MIPGSIGVVLAFVYWPVAMGNGYLNFFNQFFQQKEGIVQFRRVMLGQNVNAELMDLVRNTRQLPYRNAPPYPRSLVTYRMYDRGSRNASQELMHPSMSFPVFIAYYFVKDGVLWGIFHDFLITYASRMDGTGTKTNRMGEKTASRLVKSCTISDQLLHICLQLCTTIAIYGY